MTDFVSFAHKKFRLNFRCRGKKLKEIIYLRFFSSAVSQFQSALKRLAKANCQDGLWVQSFNYEPLEASIDYRLKTYSARAYFKPSRQQIQYERSSRREKRPVGLRKFLWRDCCHIRENVATSNFVTFSDEELCFEQNVSDSAYSSQFSMLLLSRIDQLLLCVGLSSCKCVENQLPNVFCAWKWAYLMHLF